MPLLVIELNKHTNTRCCQAHTAHIFFMSRDTNITQQHQRLSIFLETEMASVSKDHRISAISFYHELMRKTTERDQYYSINNLTFCFLISQYFSVISQSRITPLAHFEFQNIWLLLHPIPFVENLPKNLSHLRV